jgi:hypothetical protein
MARAAVCYKEQVMREISQVSYPFSDLSNAPIMIGKRILNEKKVAYLSDHLWRRYIEILIVKGDRRLIPEVNELAWFLHIQPEELQKDIDALLDAGILIPEDKVFDPTGISKVEDHFDYGVYVIKSEFGYYKIGYSSNINNRFKGLNKASPDKLQLTCVIKTKEYKELEKELHEKYSDKRYQGEWFELSDADIEYIKSLEDIYG